MIVYANLRADLMLNPGLLMPYVSLACFQVGRGNKAKAACTLCYLNLTNTARAGSGGLPTKM